MITKAPSDEYRRVAEANRAYYAEVAEMYDASETCVTNKEFQQQLEVDLSQIINFLGKPPKTLHALDACGGTGNVALKLLRRGLNVTISDISPTQLAIFEKKSKAEQFTSQTFCMEIGELLSTHTQQFDLIVFSSALHHLENITYVLQLAYQRLLPGGLLFTVFDPTSTLRHKQSTKLILWVDYLLFKLTCQTTDLPSAGVRFMRRTVEQLRRRATTGKQGLQLKAETLGVLAEYHVGSGIDDFALVADMKTIGYEVLWHHRYPGGRYRFTRWLVSRMNDATQFKLLLRKPIFTDGSKFTA